jgi:hypothetical protein
MGWTGCFPQRVSLQWLAPANKRRSSHGIQSRDGAKGVICAPPRLRREHGLSVLFDQISYGKVGAPTLQSRACVGAAGGTHLFASPAHPVQSRIAGTGIVKYQLDSRYRRCNFVEIMPRLQEHLKR